jgi:nucleoside-diphosphate-sugar epimerase
LPVPTGGSGAAQSPWLLRRRYFVRALVRTPARAAVLRDAGAEALVADLRGDVEWAAEGGNAAVFAAAAPHRSDLGSIDAGGAAKLAEAADRYEFTRFVLSSVIGADRSERREGAVREFRSGMWLRGYEGTRRRRTICFPCRRSWVRIPSAAFSTTDAMAGCALALFGAGS